MCLWRRLTSPANAGAQIYAELGPDLAPTGPSLLLGLDSAGRLTVMDAARKLDVSHVHV